MFKVFSRLYEEISKTVYVSSASTGFMDGLRKKVSWNGIRYRNESVYLGQGIA